MNNSTAIQAEPTVMTVIKNNLRRPRWMKYLEENSHQVIIDLDQLICEEFAISPEKIFTRNRELRIKNARFAYLYVMREVFKFSSTAVGRISGWDHATILHACKRVKEWMENEPIYRASMNCILNIVKESMIRTPADPLVDPGGYVIVYKGDMITTNPIRE